jgi:hypothetical protein
MSVSFNPGFAANQKVAFQKNHEKSSHSYVGSTVEGILAGGAIGASAAFATKKIAAMEVPFDSVVLSKVTKTAGNLLGKKPVRDFAHIGAAIGALALIVNTFRNKKIEAAAEKLKPVS